MARKSRTFKRDPEDGFPDMHMSDAELEALMAAGGLPIGRSPQRSPERELASLEPGTRVRGTVLDIRKGEILVELDSKTHGLIAQEEFGDDPLPAVGSVLDASFVRHDRKQGLAVLSVREARREVFWDELKQGMILEGLVTGVNKGGLTLDIKKIRAFMPISQIERERVEDPSPYVGQRLRCEVISVDRAAQDLVVSRRAILDREAAERRATALERLNEGDVLTGTVVRIADVGAFIDLGGIEGLLHRSKIAQHKAELDAIGGLGVGQKIEVEVSRIDAARSRVALDVRYRPAPGSNRSVGGYAVGEEVTGWVKRVTDDGAVLAFDEGMEGVILRCDMTEAVKEGAVLKAKIADVDAAARRIELRPSG